MKRLLKFLVPVLLGFCFFLPTHAQNSPSDSSVETNADTTLLTPIADDSQIWKYKRRIMVSFTTGTLDQKKRFGGEISSRWGVSIITGRNIYLHRKAIGGFLKFGLNIDLNLNYMNFAKGSGKISDFMHPNDNDTDSESISLGRHYITSGIALGPTATFAPFFASTNRNLASLKFRPYFHVVPSYAAYLISDNEETEIHSAFALWCAAGLEIQWKRLIAGFEWKGCTARYKGMMDSMISGSEDNFEAEDSNKFDTNMLNFSIGFSF